MVLKCLPCRIFLGMISASSLMSCDGIFAEELELIYELHTYWCFDLKFIKSIHDARTSQGFDNYEGLKFWK